MRIKDFKLIDNGTEQSVVVEFATGEVRTLSARHLYEASRALGHDASQVKSAAQRRAEEMMALRRGKR